MLARNWTAPRPRHCSLGFVAFLQVLRQAPSLQPPFFLSLWQSWLPDTRETNTNWHVCIWEKSLDERFLGISLKQQTHVIYCEIWNNYPLIRFKRPYIIASSLYLKGYLFALPSIIALISLSVHGQIPSHKQRLLLMKGRSSVLFTSFSTAHR